MASKVTNWLMSLGLMTGVLLGQIGYQGGGTSFPVEADTQIAADDVYLGLGDSNEFQLEYKSNVSTLTSSAGMSLVVASGNSFSLVEDSSSFFIYTASSNRFDLIPNPSESTWLRLEDAPAASGSGSVLDFPAALNAMDGSDTVSVFAIDIANADHTGASNALNGLLIEGITGDAQATEAAIYIEDGWDSVLDVSSDASAQINIHGSGNLHIASSGTTLVSFLGIASNQAYMQVSGSLHAGASRNQIFEINPSMAAMDGDDTYTVAQIDLVNADHTGSSNYLYGLHIDDITGDAQAEEYALVLGDGWDAQIRIDEVNSRIDLTNNSVSSSTITLGGITLIRGRGNNTAGATLEVGNGVHLDSGQAEDSVFAIDFQLDAMDGSTVYNALEIDTFSTDGAATVTTANDFNAISIEAVTTPDADVDHFVMEIGDGWEYVFSGAQAIGSDSWTTNSDKSGNTAAGTLRVEIGGTLYHIQLYADS